MEHDYESGGTGGNRFATILLYMSDLEPEDGGETVFPRGWPPNLAEEDRPSEAMVRIRNLPVICSFGTTDRLTVTKLSIFYRYERT